MPHLDLTCSEALPVSHLTFTHYYYIIAESLSNYIEAQLFIVRDGPACVVVYMASSSNRTWALDLVLLFTVRSTNLKWRKSGALYTNLNKQTQATVRICPAVTITITITN